MTQHAPAENNSVTREEFPFVQIGSYPVQIPPGFSLDQFVKSFGRFESGKASVLITDENFKSSQPLTPGSAKTVNIVQTIWPLGFNDCIKYIKAKNGTLPNALGLAIALNAIPDRLPTDGTVYGVDVYDAMLSDRGYRLTACLTRKEDGWRFWCNYVFKIHDHLDVSKGDYIIYFTD